MKLLAVPALELGVSRLFALSMTPSEARAVKADPAQQARLLGISDVASEGVEIFCLADLGDMGLTEYLRAGIDAREEDLARDRQKLMALDGWVMLVHSSAFQGAGVTLAPDATLTLIGTYAQHARDDAPIDLPSAAAEPYTGAPNITPPPSPPHGRAGPTLVVAAIGLIALLLWWVLA